MTPIPTELRELLERIAHDDEGMASLADFEELKRLLATPPADAADMGGQAGEEVEVVASLHAEHTQDNIGEYAFVVESHAWLKACRRTGGEFDLVPAAQHRRILAQHRKQAGKLAEALRKIHFRTDCFVEDDMDMRVPSIEAIVRIAGEALAAWEVKP